MVARVYSTAGTKVSIGPVYSASVDTVTEFAALSYTLVSGVSNIGDFGDTSSVIKFDVIDENRTRKSKGTRDGGALPLVMALDDTDAGQIALETAFNSASAYAIKVEFNDKLTGGGTNTKRYFYGKVTSYSINSGAANDIVRRTCNIEVDSNIYTQPAT
jgi:hypothetical protein